MNEFTFPKYDNYGFKFVCHLEWPCQFSFHTTTIHNQIGNYNKVQEYTLEKNISKMLKTSDRAENSPDNNAMTHSQDKTGDVIEKFIMSLDCPARAPNWHLWRQL